MDMVDSKDLFKMCFRVGSSFPIIVLFSKLNLSVNIYKCSFGKKSFRRAMEIKIY